MSHTHFTIEKRILLEDGLNRGISIPSIAMHLGFCPSSVYDEVKRNRLTEDEMRTRRKVGISGFIAIPKNKYNYNAKVAQLNADNRKHQANQSHRRLTDEDTPLSLTITRLLKKCWSPEQISANLALGRIKISGAYQKIRIAVQTIYDWIYSFHKELRKHLRHKRGYSHNRQYYINKKKRKERQEERGIDNRPEHINNRSRFGHWEGDTILGKDHGATGRIATFNERKSGYLVAILLPPLSASEKALPEDEQELLRITMGLRFADGAAESLGRLIKPKYLKTLTLDNGSENNGFEWIERKIPGLKVFFAHPYHSWERGSNENLNGLLRQYFPKGMDFRKITQADLDKVVKEINNRPRKRLGWRSPQWIMTHNRILKPVEKVRD